MVLGPSGSLGPGGTGTFDSSGPLGPPGTKTGDHLSMLTGF